MKGVLSAMIPFVVMGGCAAQGKTGAVSLSYDDFMKDKNAVRAIVVSNGETFTVTLFSNPTTGYSWDEKARIANPQTLQQVDHKYVAPASSGGMTGVGGTETWSFKALKTGGSTIRIEYGQPWDKGEKGAWTFQLNVTVK